MKTYVKWDVVEYKLTCTDRNNRNKIMGTFDLKRLFPTWDKLTKVQRDLIVTGLKVRLHWTVQHNEVEAIPRAMASRYEAICTGKRHSIKPLQRKLLTASQEALDQIEQLLKKDKQAR